MTSPKHPLLPPSSRSNSPLSSSSRSQSPSSLTTGYQAVFDNDNSNNKGGKYQPIVNINDEEERGEGDEQIPNDKKDIELSQNGEMGGGEVTELEKPWKYKMMALLCALSLAAGSHYAAHTLGALKSTIKKELGITNSEYGIIQSSVSLVNTILPFLGGVFIDTFGTSLGSILATSLIAAGNILVALSTHLISFHVMVLGRIMYGIGSGTIVTIQTAILSHWFKGKGLAIAVGVQIAAARLSAFLANLTVIPITRVTGFYGYAFWFASFLCLTSFTINLIYVTVNRIIRDQLSANEIRKLKQKRTFNYHNLLYFPTLYWIFVLLEFGLGSAWTSFLHIHTELVKKRWNSSDEIAAYNSSVAQFLPIFVSPFLGYLLDRFGKRSIALIVSAVFLNLSMYLLGFTSAISPIIGMVFFSISLSLGTALGIVKSTSNIGATIYDICVGLLQDLNNEDGKDGEGGENEYDLVMHLYVFTSFVTILVAVLLSIVSKKYYDGVLDMKDDERKDYYEMKKASNGKNSNNDGGSSTNYR
ncbi:21631_t:CDS:10 [Entrophospora sp. SA101]|nr:10224_t:CDS:10 [Entrophospora sp. SA101]CAJ0758209.1 21631_t:CDS:10 [Entrophospora sp. SA101]